MTKLVWRAQALDDLETIMTYVAESDVAAARRLHETIESAAQLLASRPFAFRAGRVAGTREMVVHPNYVLIYRTRTDRTEIVALVHARQQYP